MVIYAHHHSQAKNTKFFILPYKMLSFPGIDTNMIQQLKHGVNTCFIRNSLPSKGILMVVCVGRKILLGNYKKLQDNVLHIVS